MQKFEKRDTYWKKDGLELGAGVRLRRLDPDSHSALVTFKRKDLRGGLEVNREDEFEVSDAAPFERLLGLVGFAPWIEKRKRGFAWSLDGVLVELSEVEGLGWFVELELLTEAAEESVVEAARARLLACLDRIGVDRSLIEPRPYTQLLLERLKDSP